MHYRQKIDPDTRNGERTGQLISHICFIGAGYVVRVLKALLTEACDDADIFRRADQPQQ